MKKLPHEDLLRRGESLLHEWGISGDAPAARYTDSVGQDVAADLAIARRLGSLPEPESADLLRRIEQETVDRNVRKEARRSLYRLEQRGVTIPPPAALTPGPSLPLATPPEGYLSCVDGHGDQLIWLVKPRSGSLLHLFAVINDPHGLREVDLNVVTRKHLKGIRAELAAKHDLQMVEADWRYCDFLIHRAFQWARSRNGPMTGDYKAARARLLQEPPPADMPPLILATLDPEAIKADEQWLVRSDELLNEPEFRTWFPAKESVRPYLEELNEINDSPLVLSEAQKKERFQACVDRAVVEFFDREQRQSYARRLQLVAYFFRASGRDDQARQALSVSLALAENDRGGAGIPFCEALVKGALALWYVHESEEEDERQKESLVVTPRQFAAEQERHRLSPYPAAKLPPRSE